MNFLKGIKVTNNIFSYDIIGLSKTFIYRPKEKRWMTTDRETGAILDDQHFPDDLDFETFELIARNMHLDLIDSDANVSIHFELLHILN